VQASSSQQAGSSSQHVGLGDADHAGTIVTSELEALTSGSAGGNQMEKPSNDQQVAMVLLPDTLEVDPGFMALQNECYGRQNNLQNADGIRLWAKHFSLLNSSDGIDILRCWSDFFTKALLDPNSFEWAKSLLESKAWNIILNEKSSETSITFTIPKKCPSQEHVQCSTYLEESSSNADMYQQNTPDKLGLEGSVHIPSPASLKKENESKCH
jgi:hypothetical protein